jgi:outer membrane protein
VVKRFLISSVCITCLVAPQDSFGAASLKQALISTYHKNPTLDAKRSELEAARSDKIRGYAEFMPSISASSKRTYTQEKDTEYQTRSGRDRSAANALTISQNVFAGGGSLANFKALNAKVAQEEASFTSEEQKVLLDGVKAYLEIWAKEANLKVSQKAERVFKQTLDDTLAKQHFGVASQSDVEKAIAEYQRANAKFAQTQAELSGAVATYENTTGLTYETLEDPHMLVTMPTQMDDVVAAAYAANPKLIQSDRAVDQAEAEDTASKSAFLPKLDLKASLEESKQRAKNDLNDTTFAPQNRLNRSLMGELTIPLFQQGKEYAGLQQAGNTLEAKKKTRRATQQELMQNVRSTWATWQASMSQVESLTAGVKAATFVKEGVRQQYNFGIKPLYDVYQAEKDLLEAEYQLITAKQQEFMSAYQILSLTGQLTADKLKLLGGETESKTSQEPPATSQVTEPTPSQS